MNNDKTEAILIATQRTSLSHALPPTLNINGIPIEFSKSLRNLGIIFDNFFSLHQNIMNTCRAAYMELRQISSIRHFLSVDAAKTLMTSLVLSKLDYCNSLLSGSPQYLIQLFQKVQNTVARITLRAPRAKHTSPLLRFLHWLPVHMRIKHKVSSICYALLTSTSPKYMLELVNVYIPSDACAHCQTVAPLQFPIQKPRSVGNVPLLIKDQLHGMMSN